MFHRSDLPAFLGGVFFAGIIMMMMVKLQFFSGTRAMDHFTYGSPGPAREITSREIMLSYHQPSKEFTVVRIAADPTDPGMLHRIEKIEPIAKGLSERSDEEKNIIWWEIASASIRTGQVTYRYTLSVQRALPIAEKYQISVLELFKFFREGVDARWKTAEPPD